MNNHNSNESASSPHLQIIKMILAYSNGSSIASDVKAQSDPGVVLKFFCFPNSNAIIARISRHIHHCCTVDCILQILFSFISISLSHFNQSVVAKLKKHFNQFTMSLLFCVILSYRFFLPLYLPLIRVHKH